MKQKVLAYITRDHQGQRQLLVFTHRDFPQAGLQVPGGTVEEGELVKVALLREIQEEAGLSNLEVVRKLGQYEDAQRQQLRHVFHLVALDALPDQWEHTVKSTGEDKGMVFAYRWVALADT